jgi:hypothetical protein
VMRPVARRKLRVLYKEKERLLAALARARKNHGKLRYIQKSLNQNHRQCLKWERYA